MHHNAPQRIIDTFSNHVMTCHIFSIRVEFCPINASQVGELKEAVEDNDKR